MKRPTLALGAVILLVLVLVLVLVGGLRLALRDGQGEGNDARSDAPGRDEPARETTQRAEARSGDAEVASGKRTQVDAPGDASAGDTPTPTGAATKDYVVGDVRIRDHRSGDHPAADVPPAVHPPQARRLPSTLTNEFAQQLRTALASCAASVPVGARGAAPKIDGEIIIAIKDRQASITSAIFQPRDITGDANDALKQCLASKAVGLSTPSGEQADLDHYAVTLSLVLP